MFETLQQAIDFYKRNLERAKSSLETYDLKNAGTKYTVWGGVDIGMLKERITAYEGFIEDLEQVQKGELK